MLLVSPTSIRLIEPPVRRDAAGPSNDPLQPHDVISGKVTTLKGAVDAASQLDSRVTVEKGAVIENSVIRGPAIIGEYSSTTWVPPDFVCTVDPYLNLVLQPRRKR